MLGSAEFGEATVIADLEAGIGTLTRLADEGVDTVVIVVEPTPKSIEVGVRAADLAAQRGVRQLIVAANRITDDDDRARIRAAFGDAEIVEAPYDQAIVAAERAGRSPLDTAPDAPAVRALVELAGRLTTP